ncbi:MAG: 50S ribosomal protein L10 [Parcubacteria group bacterium]|nr:50S ribosomal protein L10 [Parcubacteria group bacterium]
MAGFDLEHIHETCGLAFGYEDELAPARVVRNFMKTHETCTVVAGMFEGNIISRESVLALAQIPGRTELMGQLVGTIAAPLTGLVRVFSAEIRSLLFVLSKIQP